MASPKGWDRSSKDEMKSRNKRPFAWESNTGEKVFVEKTTPDKRQKYVIRYIDSSGDSDYIDYVNNKNDARSRAVKFMRNHTSAGFAIGDTVPMMTDHGDITKVKVLEKDGDSAKVRMTDNLHGVGVNVGEETWVDVRDIQRAINLEPYERRQLRDEFQQRQKRMRSEMI